MKSFLIITLCLIFQLSLVIASSTRERVIETKGDLVINRNLIGEEISLTQGTGELMCHSIEAE